MGICNACDPLSISYAANPIKIEAKFSRIAFHVILFVFFSSWQKKTQMAFVFAYFFLEHMILFLKEKVQEPLILMLSKTS